MFSRTNRRDDFLWDIWVRVQMAGGLIPARSPDGSEQMSDAEDARGRLRELALGLLDVTAYEPCIARARAGEPAGEAAEWTYLLARMKRAQVRVAKAVLYALDNPNASERYRGGRVPYGRQVHEGHLADDPAEQAVIDRIVRLRRAGRSQRAIASALRADGVSVSRSAIQRMLLSSAILRRSKVDCQTAAALARARKLRAVFGELAGLTAWSAAKELNRRKVQTPAGGRWHANSVDRVRARLSGM
jgi:hypothetical protein